MSSLTSIKSDRLLNDLSKKLPSILFTGNWEPSEGELADTFLRVSSYHQVGRLNVDNISLYQQRLIASLMTLDVVTKKNVGNILEISNIWHACITMFTARMDSLTVEIIIRDFSNILDLKSTESKFRIISDINQLAQSTINSTIKNTPQSVRLSNIKALIAGDTESEHSNTWLKNVVRAQIKSQIDTVSIFNNLMRASASFQSELASDCNAFLMTYLKSGHVKNIWVYATQPAIDKLPTHQQVHCEQLCQTHAEQMLLVVQIGNSIWVQTARLESYGIYKLPDKYSSLHTLVSELAEKKCNNHYLFSRKGFWQYKLSLTLKSGTDFTPKRSDYLT